MISIIICSRNNKTNITLENNLRETIGVPFEIIHIDNSQNTYSIFSAYNEGIRKSRYPYICCIHEDIMFRTNRWGELICEAFKKDNSIGMIGVIGSSVIFDIYDGWWNGPLVGQILQSSKNTPIKNNYSICNDKYPNLSDAVICDGVFLAFQKILFSKIHFDTKTFKGFHCYDADISMQVLMSGYKIKILNNLLIEHYSHGVVDLKFHNECSIFMKKWYPKLPISINEISQEELSQLKLNYIIKLLKENHKVNECINISESKSWKFIYILLTPILKIKRMIWNSKNNKTHLIK